MLRYKGIKSGWLLDPIGSQPRSAIELANAGYRVLVACNNPILAKLYEVICSAPPKSEYQAAISEFGSFKIGTERLETQIKKIYQTECPACQSITNQVNFLWKKGDDHPYLKEFECPNCGLKTESTLSEQDVSNQNSIGNIHLYRSRAQQRVIPGTDVPPSAVQEALQAYLPRSLAVLTKLMNRNDGYRSTPQRKAIMDALLILACDFGSMLWGIPSGRSRPKTISIPNQFWEYNLWEILENGSEILTLPGTPVPFSKYPELPPEGGGVCLYPNRIRRREDLRDFPLFEAVAAILPRPNQALWTFSAVWAGWIWGPGAVQKLRGSLERRRYDWIWHTHALTNLFEFTSQRKTPWIAIAPELSANFLLSFVSAPAASGYILDDLAFNPENKSAQLYWSHRPPQDERKAEEEPNIILDYLSRKGESASYQELLSVNILHRAQSDQLLDADRKVDNNLFPNIQQSFESNLKNERLITKINKETYEYSDFWLANPPNKYRPLADQMEITLLQYLQSDPIVSILEIETIINQKQPGVLPANREVLLRLLDSYCDPIPGMEDTWHLRLQETINIRRSDIQIMKNLLAEIGRKLGAKVVSDSPVIWETPDHLRNYRFFVTASCILSRFLSKDVFESGDEIVIVYPGSRAELLSYKIKRDPILAQQISTVHFVKYRHLRNLNKDPGLTLQTWVKMIDSDPAIWQEFGQPVLF